MEKHSCMNAIEALLNIKCDKTVEKGEKRKHFSYQDYFAYSTKCGCLGPRSLDNLGYTVLRNHRYIDILGNSWWIASKLRYKQDNAYPLFEGECLEVSFYDGGCGLFYYVPDSGLVTLKQKLIITLVFLNISCYRRVHGFVHSR